MNYDYHLHYCPTASWGAVLGLGSVLCPTLIPCGRVLLYDKCFLLCCTSAVLMFSCKSFPWEEVKSQTNHFSSMAQLFAWQKKYLSYDKVETFFTVVSCLGIRDIKSPLQKLQISLAEHLLYAQKTWCITGLIFTCAPLHAVAPDSVLDLRQLGHKYNKLFCQQMGNKCINSRYPQLSCHHTKHFLTIYSEPVKPGE